MPRGICALDLMPKERLMLKSKLNWRYATKKMDAARAVPQAKVDAILDAIALAWHQDQPMSVREAISLKKLGSAATLHKRLSILRSEGYLEEYNTQGDKRTKLLALTPKTLLYFETLGAILALQQSSSFKRPSGT